jgi:hypothetical protein
MKLGKYKHFKGNIYEVIAIGKHSETSEELVIYKSSEDDVWVRPKVMFLEIVERENYKGPRFRLIERNEE